MVRNEPRGLVLYTPAGTEIFSSQTRATFPTAQQILHFFWPGQYYNAEIFWTWDWQFRGYYLNLALPYEWDGTHCTYVDLELDVSRFEGEEIRILDQDEYEEMRTQRNLPDYLATEMERAVPEGRARLANQAYPFDGSLSGWRPGRDLE